MSNKFILFYFYFICFIYMNISAHLCSFGLCCVQAHPPPHFAQRERRAEYTPTKTFQKKSEKPFS